MVGKIRVIDLFAGVGGFRLGLEQASKKYEFVWSNQWEPATKTQAASDIYTERFGPEHHSNQDIAEVSISKIPDFDMLVGGFPCQDYSVAKTLSQSKGIDGKKGVLWWEIHRLISTKRKKPDYVFLENVDRLLKSPAMQRGRDFAIMLASLSDLGYAVEWREINAADYGFPQRRKRVYILAYHKRTKIFKALKKTTLQEWISDKGVFSKEFHIDKKNTKEENTFDLEGNLANLSKKFNKGGKKSLFSNAGVMINRKVYTAKVTAQYSGKKTVLKNILLPESKIPKEFFISKGSLKKWKYLKGAKKEKRFTKKRDFSYLYAEGSMTFPDALDKASRTIVTGEGGNGASRFKHIVRCRSGKLRRLTPVELERLNMFPDNHTKGASDIKRAFIMGNALVVGVVEKIGKALVKKRAELDK